MNLKLITIGLLVLEILFLILSLTYATMTSIETKKIKDYYFKTVEYNIEVLDLTLFDEFKFNNYDIIMKNCYYCLIFSCIVFVLNVFILILLFLLFKVNKIYIVPFILLFIFYSLPVFIIFAKHYKNNINIKSKDEDFLYKFNTNLYYNDNALKNYKKDHNFNFNYEINLNNCTLNDFYSFINWLLGANVLLLIISIIYIIIIYRINSSDKKNN